MDFFLLNDMVDVDRGVVRFFLPFDNFKSDGYPQDVAEYRALMYGTMDFVNGRNTRISEL